MLIKLLQEYVDQKRAINWPDFVIVNALKEYLQFPVLTFIYAKPQYQNFIFMGGSALRIIYKLPRLSEDLDLNLSKSDYKNLNLKKLGEELQKYFKDNFIMNLSYRVQGKSESGQTRLYLKFPILKQLGLAKKNESDFLFVKIEPQLEDFKDPDYEIHPISGFGFNFLVKSYSLKFLMTGKIMAILERNWFKGKNNEIDIKGRDYYDLYWYLEKGVQPDWSALQKKFNFKDKSAIKKALKEKIDNQVSERKLLYDLINFFPEQDFIKNFCHNYKEIINRYL